MEDVAGVEAELLTSGNTITINIFDHGNRKPISTKGFSGAIAGSGGAGRRLSLPVRTH